VQKPTDVRLRGDVATIVALKILLHHKYTVSLQPVVINTDHNRRDSRCNRSGDRLQ